MTIVDEMRVDKKNEQGETGRLLIAQLLRTTATWAVPSGYGTQRNVGRCFLRQILASDKYHQQQDQIDQLKYEGEKTDDVGSRRE